MSSTIEIALIEPGVSRSKRDTLRASQENCAATNPVGFLTLAVQIVGLLFLFYYYHLENLQFMQMSVIVFAAFFVHYWLPFRFKEIFWVAVSIAGSFVLLNTLVAALVLGAGLAIFLILHSPLAFRWRLVATSAVFATLIYGCVTGSFGIPHPFYAVFGGIFMFRVIIYVYDLAHAKKPPSLLSYLSYFFILPNYYLTLFPVIDFQTMRSTYYRRNIHDIAQQGIFWIVRGGVQLMLYRVVLYFDDPFLPDRVTSLPKLITTMILTYLLYLNVSGKFHIVVGMLHLFGYDLPETNRRYLLANSFLDYWRRINIYWKDFMLKVVYFPVYFKFRKRGDLRAQILGSVAVFAVSWAAHSYQSLWIAGKLSFSWTDTIFWGLLGALVIANVIYESRRKPQRTSPRWWDRSLLAIRTGGTFATIVILWSLWSSPTISSWLYLMTRWTGGAAQ
jgi:alginate O-acetyltransferase complex protein AlgI